jgi:signal recognition particle subunit SRP68
VQLHEDGGAGGGATSAAAAVAAKEGSKARHAYRAIDMTNLPSEILESHVNYFLEPLYCAERCWAASMAIKAEGDQLHGRGGSGSGRGASASASASGALGNFGGGNSKKDWSPGKIRAHSIKRLRKAVKFASLLETLTTTTKTISEEQGNDEMNGHDTELLNTGAVSSKPPVDEHTQLEARAYAAWMRGNLALEQNQWQEACNEYQTALTLCETLAAASDTNSAAGDTSFDGEGGAGDNNNLRQLELFDFFTTRAQNVIAPLWRYSDYELQVCWHYSFFASSPL